GCEVGPEGLAAVGRDDVAEVGSIAAVARRTEARFRSLGFARFGEPADEADLAGTRRVEVGSFPSGFRDPRYQWGLGLEEEARIVARGSGKSRFAFAAAVTRGLSFGEERMNGAVSTCTGVKSGAIRD